MARLGGRWHCLGRRGRLASIPPPHGIDEEHNEDQIECEKSGSERQQPTVKEHSRLKEPRILLAAEQYLNE